MTNLFSNITKISLFVCGILFCIAASAEMYKWVDEDGNTHYSQSPPVSDVEVETIKPPPTIDIDAANKALEEQKKKADKLKDERLTAKEEKKKAEEETAQKQKECDMAKKRLASYQRPRVNVKNPDGSLRVIEEEERQAEIKKSKEYIEKACN